MSVVAHELDGMDGGNPLGFLAAVGLLRVLNRTDESTRILWENRGTWSPTLHLRADIEPVDSVMADLARWRNHGAVEFAVDADRKIQDLKHPPAAFRELMRDSLRDAETSAFIAAYATGVAIDGSGQTKPTSFHFCAGQQRFMDFVLDLRNSVTREDVVEALHGPWLGRVGPKDLRWNAGSDRNRALLGVDPSTEKSASLAGATWLAFQALPAFPVVPVALRAVTTGFTGRGKHERFTWPIWTEPLTFDAVRALVGTSNLAQTKPSWRAARGVAQVFEAAVLRSAQGYGNFAGADPR